MGLHCKKRGNDTGDLALPSKWEEDLEEEDLEEEGLDERRLVSKEHLDLDARCTFVARQWHQHHQCSWLR